jgi:hypothetical protein
MIMVYFKYKEKICNDAGYTIWFSKKGGSMAALFLRLILNETFFEI